MKVLFSLLVLLWAHSSIALVGIDHNVGNGGDVITCQDGRVMMLDLYEGSTHYGLEYDWGDTQDSPMQLAERVIGNWADKDPILMEELTDRLSAFMSEANFLRGIELVDIPDSNHIALPDNCEIQQIAINRKPRFPGEKRYTIDQDLWEQLKPSGQAGLILHEILYTMALEQGHRNSVAVRYFTAYLSSTEHTRWNPLDYKELFSTMRLKKSKALMVDGILLRIREYNDNGFPVRGSVLGQQEISLAGNQTATLKDNSSVFFDKDSKVRQLLVEADEFELIDGSQHHLVELIIGKKRKIRGGTLYTSARKFDLPFECAIHWREGFEIHRNGSLKSLWTRDPNKKEFQVCVPGFSDTFQTIAAQAKVYGWDDPINIESSFYRNGAPKTIVLIEPDKSHGYQIVEVKNQGKIAVGEYLVFHRNGHVSETRLMQDTFLKTVEGDSIDFKSWSTIKFNRNGLVTNEQESQQGEN